MALKDKLSKALWWTKRIILFFLLASLLSVILFRFVPIPFTPLMVVRAAEQLIEGKDIILKKDWKSLEEISPNLPLAVMASEDQLFLEHFGFDFKSIQKAFENNSKKSKRIKGASTISQQVAKNVFLWQGRSYFRKALEAYFTLLIEIFWSKQRIMEVYLNVAEMGNGIYGAEACSRKYFYKSAKSLTRPQSALIAAVLPNPRRWNPAKPTGYINQRKNWIVRNMNNLGAIVWE